MISKNVLLWGGKKRACSYPSICVSVHLRKAVHKLSIYLLWISFILSEWVLPIDSHWDPEGSRQHPNWTCVLQKRNFLSDLRKHLARLLLAVFPGSICSPENPWLLNVPFTMFLLPVLFCFIERFPICKDLFLYCFCLGVPSIILIQILCTHYAQGIILDTTNNK